MTIESNYAIAPLSLVIGLKISRQFINHWEGNPKPITTCTPDFSRALSKLHGIATNLDWFIVLLAPAVIHGGSNYFVLRNPIENRSICKVLNE